MNEKKSIPTVRLQHAIGKTHSNTNAQKTNATMVDSNFRFRRIQRSNALGKRSVHSNLCMCNKYLDSGTAKRLPVSIHFLTGKKERKGKTTTATHTNDNIICYAFDMYNRITQSKGTAQQFELTFFSSLSVSDTADEILRKTIPQVRWKI